MTTQTSTSFDRTRLRPGQIEAIDKIIDNARNQIEFTPIILPTGYGKSDVIRMSSIFGYRLGIIPVSIIASPNVILRDQIINEKKVRQMLRRYRVGATSNVLSSPMDKVRMGMPFNGDIMMSATIQLLAQPYQLQLLAQWVESIVSTTGKRPLLHIDEAHQTSQQNVWGSLNIQWRRAGGIVVLYTATPERHDNIQIPGIPLKTVDIEHIQVCRWKPGKTPEMIEISVYDAMKQQVTLDMDYVKQYGTHVSFRTAWDESIICHIQRIPFDIELAGVDMRDEDGATKLSELSESKTRLHLGKLVRDREAIYAGSRLLVQELSIKRRNVHDSAAIVYCGNDNEQDNRESNAHAKAIEKAIKQIDPSLQVVIATSATGNDDTDAEKAGQNLIKAFGAGKGDVLIVKQMAGVGLDIERLKVVLDLSPTRTAPAFIQRLNRATRPYENLYVCSYITPDDCLARALFMRFVENENGDASKISQGDLISTFEKKKRDRKDEPTLMVDGTKIGGLDDSKGKYQDGEMYGAAMAFIERFPVLAAGHTHNDIIEGFKDIGMSPREEDWNSAQNTAQLADQIRQDCVEKARTVTSKISAYDHENPALWRTTHIDIWNRAKSRAGIPTTVNLEDIREVGLLRRIKGVLLSMEKEVTHA